MFCNSSYKVRSVLKCFKSFYSALETKKTYVIGLDPVKLLNRKAGPTKINFLKGVSLFTGDSRVLS